MTASHYKAELDMGKHKKSGHPLTQEETQHRLDALKARERTLPVVHRQKSEAFLAKITAKLKEQADRVVAETSSHTTKEADRVVEQVVAALKVGSPTSIHPRWGGWVVVVVDI